MERLFSILVVASFLSSCGNTYYVVRHAEKAQASEGVTMVTTNDPPLTLEGMERAKALQELLNDKQIRWVFSTDTKRTLATAKPVAETFSLTPILYSRVDSAFIYRLKSTPNNVLVIGHSNTVDDIVNLMTGHQHIAGDLPDGAYDNLYIIRRKGNRMKFTAVKYGAPTK